MDGVSFYSEKPERKLVWPHVCTGGLCSGLQAKDMCKGNRKMKTCIINDYVILLSKRI